MRQLADDGGEVALYLHRVRAANGSERQTAVAVYYSCKALGELRTTPVVTKQRGVCVAVYVNEAGREAAALRLNDLNGGGPAQSADGGYFATLDSNVANIALGPGAIHYQGSAYQYVKHFNASLICASIIPLPRRAASRTWQNRLRSTEQLRRRFLFGASYKCKSERHA